MTLCRAFPANHASIPILHPTFDIKDNFSAYIIQTRFGIFPVNCRCGQEAWIFCVYAKVPKLNASESYAAERMSVLKGNTRYNMTHTD